MPPPIGLQPGTSFYDLAQNNKDDNRLNTLYATNRIPHTLFIENDSYTIFPSDDLRVGVVTHSVGGDADTWEDFYEKSLSRERKDGLLISMQKVDELLTIEEDQPIDTVITRDQKILDKINEVLTRTADKDITIYVHGANSNFYRATAQGAQYFHYTGHNSLVLTYSWPSAENLFKYKVDVLHASKTVPAFTRLLEFLALHTSARNINILSYSAGAQVVAPSLVLLRENHADLDVNAIKNKYRIGEVYFAAPDIELQSFGFRLDKFKDIVGRITISSNMKDSVLRHAQRFTGKSRLGRPSADEITLDERDILRSMSQSDILDIIDIKGSYSLKAGTSHSFWYSHPWVSNDLLLMMLLHLSPEERGLVSSQVENGLTVYHFPENYEERVRELVDELRRVYSIESRKSLY